MSTAVRPCSEPSCPRELVSRGYCDRHYRQRKKAGTLPPKVKVVCAYPDCGLKNYAYGLCRRHYLTERSDSGFAKESAKKCLVEGCPKFQHAREVCGRHYGQAHAYSLTGPELRELLMRPCEICGGPSACIDHDHSCCPGDRSCGKCVRGALCRTCNSGLGYFRDNPATLRAAAEYLSRNAVI